MAVAAEHMKEWGCPSAEQGPIRPPSETHSLLLRITRNCPWNQCAFCPVYKGETHAVRSEAEIMAEIDALAAQIRPMRSDDHENGVLPRAEARALAADLTGGERRLFALAYHWVYAGGMQTVFLQDADSLVAPPGQLVRILRHLRATFPSIRRVTSYARSRTVLRYRLEDLARLREAGLTRLHVGLESGSDAVLRLVSKGVTKAQHIEAGRKAKEAGLELSEYVMPGLGGRPLSESHARETADAIRQIDPDFVRIRTLALPKAAPLYDLWQAGQFERCTDLEMVRELRCFIAGLDDVTSMLRSDHLLNLFGELEGQLPDAKEPMLRLLDGFLALPEEEQVLFQLGRRLGILGRLADLERPEARERAMGAVRDYGATPENVDEVLDKLMARFM